jgi:hypothetical protein
LRIKTAKQSKSNQAGPSPKTNLAWPIVLAKKHKTEKLKNPGSCSV